MKWGSIVILITAGVLILSGCQKASEEATSSQLGNSEIQSNQEDDDITGDSNDAQSGNGGKMPGSQAPSSLNIEAIEHLPEDFIKGVDISTLTEMEEFGQKYYDDEGNERDLFEILQEHGVNYIRVRLWNDPYDVSWSKDLSSTGQIIEGAIGAGTCDLNNAISLSQRAKAHGMKVLLDFHYSDFWADPGKQYKPDAWQGLSNKELKKAVYDFTYSTLETMNRQGALPDMVQIGNEINSGLIWPEGRGITSQGAFELLGEGTTATRAISVETGQNIQIMIHLAEGGDRHAFMEAFDSLTLKGLDYDIIGASYYPYWHGTIKELELNLRMLEERYGKKVLVAEMAYGYGFDDSDSSGNIFNSDMVAIGGYEASVQGQGAYIRDVMATVASIRDEKGLGVFYWEPAWLTPEGAGWISGEGNAWENQCLFDVEGHALDSLDAFYLVYEAYNQGYREGTYKNYEPIDYKIDQGQKVTLPYRALVAYTDGRYHEMTVAWENLPLGYNETPGIYQVSGVIEDLETSIMATIEVVENNNILTNGGFENALSSWFIEDKIMKLGKEAENPFTGRYALNYWAAADFSGEMRYDTSQIPDGTYDLSVFIMGASLGATDSYLFVRTASGEQVSKIEVVGFNNWQKITINDIIVTDGQFDFGIHLEETGGSWGWIDDFQLVPK